MRRIISKAIGRITGRNLKELQALEAGRRRDLEQREAACRETLNAKEAECRDLDRKLSKVQAGVTRYRTTNLSFFPLDNMPETCLICKAGNLMLSTYPFHGDLRFLRQIMVWCPSCGFGWTPSLQFDLADYYRDAYATTNRKDRDIPPEEYFSEDARQDMRYFRRARHQVALLQSSVTIERMLDFGSGPGYALYVSQAQEKHAIELDEHSWKYLDYINARRISLETIPSDFYDAIIASHTIEHLHPDDLYPTMQALVSSLRPGGCILIEVPFGCLIRYELRHKQEPHTLFFSAQAIHMFCERFGLEIVYARTHAQEKMNVRSDALYEPPPGNEFFASPSGSICVIGRRPAA